MRDLREHRAPGPTALPIGLPADGEDWEGTALCRSEDPALFFGPNRFEPKRERLAREATAKAICADCPALDACREHALRHNELYGVWGGLGESDRRAILAGGGPRIARTA